MYYISMQLVKWATGYGEGIGSVYTIYGHGGQFWSSDKAYLLELLFLQPMEARYES